MTRFRLVAALALAVPACLEPEAPSTSTDPLIEPAVPLAFPVEVMPTDQADFAGATFATDRTFTLTPANRTALAAGGWLYLQGHGLGYRDGFTRNDGKGSVSLNGGPEILLDNVAPVIAHPESAYQGIGGGFRTVRLKIHLATLCLGVAAPCLRASNTIRFRFHGTDGTTSGYRILDLDLLSTTGTLIVDGGPLPANLDLAWGSPAPDDPDIAAGERLWRARNSLYAGPAGAAMIAACSDCHAQDGTDLEYFGFSDRSIISRSVFHGLTLAQGERIATYIRSLPAPRHGRPWNPPYQPGAGTDLRGVDRWAAGAGLGAVLDHENDAMLDAIFPDRTSADTIAASIRGTVPGTAGSVELDARTLNLRDLPIAIQLPDWNSWLPEHHPLDLWGVCAWEGAGDGTLAAAQVQPGGVGAEEPVLADLDDDKLLDAVVIDDDGDHSNSDQDDGIRVQLGNGDGTFKTATSVKYVTGGDPEDLAIADLDGDGHDDVLVASRTNDTVYVLRGDGHGGLAAPAAYSGGDGAWRLAIGDFDGDFDIDVATVDHLGDTLTVMRNDGGALTVTATHAVGHIPRDVAAGDMNGDSMLDLVVTNSFDHAIGVMAGDGAGGFAAQELHPAGFWPQRVALGDLDRDGDLDLAVMAGGLLVSNLINDGGSFTLRQYASVNSPEEVGLADLDRDGWLDMLLINRLSGTALVSVYRGQPGGTLLPAVTYQVGAPPTGLAIGDVDRDFAADVVVTTSDGLASSGLSVLRGHDCGEPAVAVPPPSLVYDAMRVQLATLDLTDPADLSDLAKLPDLIGSLGVAMTAYIGDGWVSGVAGQKGLRTIRGAVIDVAVRNGYSHELVKRSLAQWTAVKFWEVMREFDLEKHGVALYGHDDGEKLQWPTGGHQSVFFIAPHITSGDQDHYSDPTNYPVGDDACDVEPVCTAPVRHNAQTQIKGDYDSSSWYHLQMLLHPGARSRAVPWDTAVSPVDWPYVLEHVDDLPRDIAGPLNGPAPWESLRFIASLVKVYQMRNNQMGPALIGWSMRDISPRILVGNWRGEADHTELLAGLDRVEFDGPGLRLKVTDAFLRAFLEVVDPAVDARFTRASWPRLTQDLINDEDDRASWWRIDVTAYEPTPAPPNTHEFRSQGMFHHADHICRALPLLRTLGASVTLVDQLETWAEYQWPGPGGPSAPQDFRTRCP